MQWIAYKTLSQKEIRRFSKIWIQTILPPLITSSLYFLIFGTFLVQDPKYAAFLAPGLIMMTIINNSFANTVSSLFQSKLMKNIEELLVSSMTPLSIVLGFLTGGIIRGLITGLGVFGITIFFTPFSIHNIGWILFFSVGSAALFALLGIINALYAKTFDDISIIPTFFLTPMIYLGGVFYSIHSLPEIWKTISFYNPLLYIIDGFRYGFLGFSDISIYKSAFSLFTILLIAFLIAWKMMITGKNIRS